jgi:hypothetical protein
MRTFHYTLGLGLALALLLVAVSTVQAQSGVPGTVLLDDYPGATDDDKLTAALADVQTKTYIPAILLSGRTYTFTKTQTSFSGLKIVGPPAGYFNSELSSGHFNSVKVPSHLHLLLVVRLSRCWSI